MCYMDSKTYWEKQHDQISSDSNNEDTTTRLFEDFEITKNSESSEVEQEHPMSMDNGAESTKSNEDHDITPIQYL
eukprot:Ihof_evm2s949 gene=Ihof_evmTU2s949